MYCRRSAVDDDRSRKTRLAFDDVRRQERWAVDDDRSRIDFYQAQSKESLDRIDRNLDLIRENLRAIRKMRKTSATIPRYSPSSSSISSFASRRHRPSRHDYPPLELPLRWREPPPLKPTKPHSAPFVRPMSSGEVDSDFIADPFQEHAQQLVGTRQVSAPATSAGVQDLANPAGDLISAHSASDSPTQHVSELDLSLPDLSIITGPDSVDEVYMNVGGEEMSKDDEDDCEVDQKMSENDDEDEGKDFRWSPDPGGTIQLSLPLSVASTPPLIQDRFSRFLDFSAAKTENPLCSRHFAPGIELHLSRPYSSIAAGLGIERRSPVVDPNRIPSSIFARSSMTPMEWSVAASESLFSIHMASLELDRSACIKVSPNLLGLQNDDTEWVNVELHSPKPSSDDWVGVFSPANFNASTCPTEVGNSREQEPFICSSPIKYQFANYSNAEYIKTGNTTLRFQMINQRSDFSFALFRGGLASPKLIAVSNTVSFANPKAPLYPRLAQGKLWNEMTITWTSGYNIDEALPFVEWGPNDGHQTRSPAGTLTFSRNDMCGSPARTFGWRHPGYIHTSFLKELWPNTMYSYKLGHQLFNGSYVWSKAYSFRASPYPGQDSLQRVIIFGDMGKAERDGSNEFNNYQPGSLNTTDQLIKDLDNIDVVFHIGDITYANGYLSQWDQFTAQIEPIASAVPYMIASGNHERDWPNTGSFYNTMDSGGECGVLAETMFYVPTDNRAKFWYSSDFGMFRFCIADTEHDWRKGTEQYKFIENCLSTADRQKQPWLIFLAHRVLGYSSDYWYAKEGTFAEPMGRESLEFLWQKYRVDIALFGHVHNYERTCPVYQSQCVNNEESNYVGTMNGTIHVVVGGGGSHLSEFSNVQTAWSLYKDYDHGFVKLTAFNHSSLLFEYKKSSNGGVYDSFTISREYKDVLACVHDSCSPTTLAS